MQRRIRRTPPPPAALSRGATAGRQAGVLSLLRPRVLRVYLPTCNAKETEQFFGPIEHYLVEGETPDKLLQFGSTDKGADAKIIELSRPAVTQDK